MKTLPLVVDLQQRTNSSVGLLQINFVIAQMRRHAVKRFDHVVVKHGGSSHWPI